MRVLILGVISFLFFSFSLFSYAANLQKKPILQEEAVFKIKKNVFFLSDLVPTINGVHFFRCLSSSSLILQGVGLNERVLLTVPKIKSVQSLNKSQEDFLGKIIQLIKISSYIKERQKEINESLFRGKSYKSCQRKVFGKLLRTKTVSGLMLTESFLRDRFDPKSQIVDGSQYEIFKRKNKFLNEKALKEAFKRKKNIQIVESIKLFIDSLDKRISHETYF